MKKTLFKFLIVAIAAGLLLTGCSAGNKDDNSWKEIKEKGYFVVGLDDAFPPMGFRDENNNIVGFDIDLAKEVAKRIGVDVKFQPVEWSGVTQELNGKKIDLIWNGLTITETRKKEIAFTNAYIEDKQILVVAKGSDIKSKKDLDGKVVGLQAGSSSREALDKDEETLKSIKDVVEFSTNDEALMDLKAGRVDAVIVDEVVGRYYIAKKKDDYEVLDDNFGVEEFGVGIRKSDKSFLNELQKALDDMKKDGTSAEISKKWFGEDIIK